MPRLRPRGPPPQHQPRFGALLRIPGLGLVASATQYDGAAVLAMPGLSIAALVGNSANVLAMPGLAIPKAIVSAPGLGAVLAMPGLAVPLAVVTNVVVSPSATLAMPGLAVAATAVPATATFLLAPDYRRDWAKLQSLVSASEVQIGAPVSNGVRFSGGPGGGDLVGNIADWSRNKSGPGWTATFTLKKTDGYVPAAGAGTAFLDFYFGVLGDGSVIGGGPSATLAMPGLAVTARAEDTVTATLALPGLALRADFFVTALAMPGLAVTATVADVAGVVATLAMPGLAVTATVASIRRTLMTATLDMPGLEVHALVADDGAAVLAMPGLAVTATVASIRLTQVAATLGMPGIALTATVVLDWTIDVNLAGQQAFESPNGVVGVQDFNQLFYGIYGGTGATFGNIAPVVTGGMTLGGGTTGSVNANNLLMVSRVRQQGDFVASFATRMTSSNALPGGQTETGLYFYFGLTGDGSPGHPSQVYTWDQTVAPSTALLSANATGCLIPLYFRNAGGAQSSVFARVIDGGGNATLVTGSTTGSPAFVQNAAYTWTVTRAGNTLTIAQTGAATSTTTITSPLIGQLANGGSFAFLVQPGRTVEVTRFTFVGTAGGLAGLLTGGRPNIWPSGTVTFGFPTAAYPWPGQQSPPGHVYTDTGAGYQRDLDSVTTVADAALKAATQAAFAAWAAATGLTFVNRGNIASPTAAQIKVVYSNVVGAEGATDANTFGPNAFGSGETDGRDGVVMIRADWPRAWPNFNPGGYGFQALMHELGHALGLRHPPFATPVYPYAQTIMNPDTSREPAFATAPRPLDGTALQVLYGLAPGAAAVFGGGAASGQGFPVDMAAWAAFTEPARPLFAAHATGARLSFFVQTAAAPGETVDPALVVFHADGSETVIPGIES